MTELVVRRLLVDLETPFARRWCGGDAFRTAFFNALSMSFPVGEQFGPWRQYLREDFHPSQHGSDRSERWLAEHSAAYVPVGAR